MRRQIFNLWNRFTFFRRRAAPEFSPGFQPTGQPENIPASRERRMNHPQHLAPERDSTVADATWKKIHGPRVLKPCLYAHFDAFLARGCGRQHKSWSGASAEPQVYCVSTHQARGAGDSFLSCAISSSLRLGQWLSPAPRACARNTDHTWGSATLHPRLYSAARIRGLRMLTLISRKIVGNDKGFQPTGRSENIPASRQRRLNPPQYLEPEPVSVVADATRIKIHGRRGLIPTAKFRRRSAAEKRLHKSQNLMRSSIFDLQSPIFGPRSPILLRVFRVLPVFVFAILTSSPCAFAQFRTTRRQTSETQGSRADQLPLSGRSGQTGSVTATQTPTPGTTTSVNTINPAVQTQGPFSGSVWGAARAPFSGRLSLREAVGRGIDFNLGAVGLTNAVAESRAQRKIVRSALLPNISGYL